MTAVAAVVFDFDGVILESSRLKGDAFLELFSEYPEHHDALMEHHLDHLGISRFEKFDWFYRQCLGRPLEPGESVDLGERYAAIVRRQMAGCPFVPGALDALRALSHRLPLFIASGTPQEELLEIVEKRELTAYFRRIWGSPFQKPAAIEAAARIAGCSVSKVLMIGDGVSDHRAAVEAGCLFLGRRTADQAGRFEGLGLEMVEDLVELPSRLNLAAGARP